jgi:glycosyltransferase involved in cell wall biosynthesis
MSVPAPADRATVAALIPAFLEERHIRRVVTETLRQLDCVYVVDDGSSDRTSEEARAGGAQVIRHDVNQGKGAAIKTGFRELLKRDCEFVLILDGDGQHLPTEIPRFLGEDRAHLLVGNRMSDAREMPFVRRLTNRFMSWQISRVCRQRIPDSQCGFRRIHRSLIPKLFVESNAYDYETEMLFIAARDGFTIGSVPVSTVYGDETSKIRPVRDTLRFFSLISRY